MREIITKPLILTAFLGAIAIGAVPVRAATPNAGAPDQSPAPGVATPRISPGANETPVPQHSQPGPSASSGSLSGALSHSGGVIHPPPSADHAVIKPPNQGASRTPVIPPPGTPGGNPLIQPK